MKCLKCQKQTDNPKFCGRSCGVAYNNSAHPKRKRQSTACQGCAKNFYTVESRKQQYCSRECLKKTRRNKIKQVGRFDLTGQPSSKTVREYLINTVGNVCVICAQDGLNWCGKKLTLIVDHADGDAHNWRISNIRLVCPNCDSQLPTFKGRNKGKSTRKYTITQK